MKRFYVTMTWEDWPEGGSYGNVVEAKDQDEAEFICRRDMAELRTEGNDEGDMTAEEMLEAEGHNWHVVDCLDLDAFIAEHAASDQVKVGILDKLESVRNWLNEAPIAEIEAVEKALGRNAPITEINDAIGVFWKLFGKRAESTTTSLAEGLADMVITGRIEPGDIPDDWEWLIRALHDAGEDLADMEPCRECGAIPGTPAYGTVGDGYDGLCGNCADRHEEADA